MLIVELILLILGVKALIEGMFPVGKGQEATGLGARLAGLFLMAPLPIIVVVVAEAASEASATGVSYMIYVWDNGLIWVELGILVLCAFLGYATAAIACSIQTNNRRTGYEGRDSRHTVDNLPLIGAGTSGPDFRRRLRKRPKKHREVEGIEEIEEIEDIEVVEDRPRSRRASRRASRQEDEAYEDDRDEDDFDRPPRRSRRWLILTLAIGLPLFLLLGGLVLFLVLNSSSLTMQEFGAAGNKFRVRMPPESKEIPRPGGGALHLVEAKLPRGLLYQVTVYGSAPFGATLDRQQNELDQLGRRLARSRRTVTSSARLMWDSGSPGRDLAGEVADGKSRFRARLWLVDRRLYFLLVQGPPDLVKSSESSRFLDSLELPAHPRSR